MILIYHNINGDSSDDKRSSIREGLPLRSFEQQLDWLTRHRRVVHLGEYLKLRKQNQPAARRAVALTFDDGVASTFRRAYPLLRERNLPATFFISTSHLTPGRLLWFSYFYALCLEGIYDSFRIDNHCFELTSLKQRRAVLRSLLQIARASGNAQAFKDKVAANYPLPAAVISEYEGLSAEQLSLFKRCDLIEGGAHTVNHPYLQHLPKNAQAEEIVQGRKRLSDLTAKSVRYFAYPHGDYNHDTLEVVKEAGFDAAFATRRRHLDTDDQFEIERVGIYSTSFFKFWLKMQGAGKIVRSLK